MRTPQLGLTQEIENALRWDPKKTQVLLNNLQFINDQELPSSKFGHITMDKVSKMVYPFGWQLVAPLVISGIETLAMMSQDMVGQNSYINPHGDLNWVTFGLQDINVCK